MPASDLHQIAARLKDANTLLFRKLSLATKGAGYWQSMWAAGGTPAAGAAAGSVNGRQCTRATTGAAQYVDPVAGLITQICDALFSAGQKGRIVIYDRLWDDSALNASIITLQAIAPPALPRYADGEGVELWGETHAAFGAVNTNFTAKYKNQAGVGAKTAVYPWTHGAPVAGQMFPFPLQTGDRGVTALESLQLSVDTGAAGNLGLVLLKRLCSLAVKAADSDEIYDFIRTRFRQVQDNACLAIMVHANAATTGDVDVDANLIQS